MIKASYSVIATAVFSHLSDTWLLSLIVHCIVYYMFIKSHMLGLPDLNFLSVWVGMWHLITNGDLDRSYFFQAFGYLDAKTISSRLLCTWLRYLHFCTDAKVHFQGCLLLILLDIMYNPQANIVFCTSVLDSTLICPGFLLLGFGCRASFFLRYTDPC